MLRCAPWGSPGGTLAAVGAVAAAAACWFPAALCRPSAGSFSPAGNPVPSPPLVFSQAPGYFSVIKQPMDFSTMKAKASKGQYKGWEDLRADMR